MQDRSKLIGFPGQRDDLMRCGNGSRMCISIKTTCDFYEFFAAINTFFAWRCCIKQFQIPLFQGGSIQILTEFCTRSQWINKQPIWIYPLYIEQYWTDILCDSSPVKQRNAIKSLTSSSGGLRFHYTSSKGNISVLLVLCAGNPPVTGEFLSQRGYQRGPLMFLCCYSEQTMEQTFDWQGIRDAMMVIWHRRNIKKYTYSNDWYHWDHRVLTHISESKQLVQQTFLDGTLSKFTHFSADIYM